MKKYFPIILFLLFLALFLIFQQSSLFQHDGVRFAAYAEHKVHTTQEPALEWFYQKFEQGNLPWRTGTHFMTAATYKLFHTFGATSAEFSSFFIQWILGALGIVFLYLLLKELYNKPLPAFLTTLIFTLSAPIFSSILAKDSGGEYLFAFLSLYLLIKALKTNNLTLFTLSSASLGLLFWMREGGIFFPAVYYGFFILYTLNNLKINKTHYNIKTIAAILLPFIIVFYGPYKIYLKSIFINSASNSGYPFFTYTSFIFNEFKEFYPLLFFLLIGIGAYYAIKHKEKFALASLAASIFFIIVFTKSATFDLRHLGIYTLFFWAIIQCYALKHLLNNKKTWKRTITFLLVIIICLQVFLPIYKLTINRHKEMYPTTFSKEIQTLTPENAVIFVPEDFRIIISYYAKRHTEDSESNILKKINSTLQQNKTLYILYQITTPHLDQQTQQAMEEQFAFSLIHEGAFENYHHADLKQKIFTEQLIQLEEMPLKQGIYKERELLVSTKHNNQKLIIEGKIFDLSQAPHKGEEIAIFRKSTSTELQLTTLEQFTSSN